MIRLADEPIVITGIGLVTPLGANRESSWAAIRNGQSAVRTLPELLPHCVRFVGAPASDFARADGNGHRAHPSSQQLQDDDPVALLARRAAAEAMADARLNLGERNRDRVGCVIGSSKGGIRSFARCFVNFTSGSQMNAQHWRQFPASCAASSVAAEWDLRGPLTCPVAACATGLVAVLRAAQYLQDGDCDVVLAGSADASLEPTILATFRRLGVLAPAVEPASQACRPFDTRRSGFAVGEGAAVFVLERLSSALQRRAAIYAELLAGTLAAEGYDLVQLRHSPEVLSRVITTTLRKADVAPDELDYINVHGTATRDNDVLETRAFKHALGRNAYRTPLSATKSMIGHLLGAAGSVELAITLLAMRDGVVPPTINLTEPDPQCDLDYTPLTARPRRMDTALKVSLGFGGHVVALAVRRPPAANSR